VHLDEPALADAGTVVSAVVMRLSGVCGEICVNARDSVKNSSNTWVRTDGVDSERSIAGGEPQAAREV